MGRWTFMKAKNEIFEALSSYQLWWKGLDTYYFCFVEWHGWRRDSRENWLMKSQRFTVLQGVQK